MTIKRSSFESFKSAICHRVRELGDINFIIYTLERQEIRIYYEQTERLFLRNFGRRKDPTLLNRGK